MSECNTDGCDRPKAKNRDYCVEHCRIEHLEEALQRAESGWRAMQQTLQVVTPAIADLELRARARSVLTEHGRWPLGGPHPLSEGWDWRA